MSGSEDSLGGGQGPRRGTLAVRVLLPLTVLVLSVPWFFDGGSDGRVMGLPAWAFFGIVGTFLYAAIVAVCLHLFWDPPPEDDHKNGKGQRDG